MDDLIKKMNIPNYDTKVPESVRYENAKKFSGYETEFSECSK
jgi:hypothetical protein